MGTENEIVFEDLHGVNEDEPVTIDLDASSKDDGITRTPADQAAGADAGGDDDIRFDDLPGAQGDEPAAPAKIADDDDVSKTGDDDAYSKKVKARIQRANRGTKAAKDEADYWKGEAVRLATETYNRDKKAAERTIEQADARIEDTQSQLEAAIEDGKTKDQVRLTSLLTDLKAEKISAEFSLDNLSPDGNVQPFSGKVQPDTSSEPKKSDQWMEDRGDWYGAKGFERQTRLANRLDKEVYKDGYDPNTDEYFEELDRRIKEKSPDLYDDVDASADDAPDSKSDKRPTRSPVAGVGGAEGNRQRSSSSKVELNEDDFANMRRFNLDPNDPEVLKEYARNKRESDQGARR
jgi:hypothetical protein